MIKSYFWSKIGKQNDGPKILFRFKREIEYTYIRSDIDAIFLWDLYARFRQMRMCVRACVRMHFDIERIYFDDLSRISSRYEYEARHPGWFSISQHFQRVSTARVFANIRDRPRKEIQKYKKQKYVQQHFL